MRRAGDASTMFGVTSTAPIEPRRIAIVGGGVAGLEVALALDHLAETQVSVTVIAPERVFTPRALDLARPSAGGQAAELDLERFMAEHGGRFRRTAVLGVNAERRTLSCTTGPDEPYDTLVVAVGASARPAYEHALTFGADFPACDELLAELAHRGPLSVAFVVPKGCTWPVPLYELAVMTADEARLPNSGELRVHLVTPERRALDLFGARASTAVAELLRAARVGLHCGIDADVDPGGRVGLGPEETLTVDRVVALAHLVGPSLAGLPADAHGFIPVDEYGRVTGVDAVYAAGDVTNHPIKHGGLASQQADAVAAHIASRAGAPVEAVPYTPVLRGRLLTELRATRPALWHPPAMVSGRYLAPYLGAHGLVAPPPRQSAQGDGIDVRLPLSWFTQSVERRELLRDLPAAGA
jgi:sulfide:quinone oxidoreductase